jgi:hypothetical protein
VRAWNLVTKDLPSTIQEIINGKEENVPAPVDSSSLVGKERLTNVLVSYVSDVFDSQTTDYTLISFAETKGLTPAFNVLGQQINVIKTDIIGDKNKEGSLIKNL